MRKSWIVCVQDAIEPGANRILMTETRARLHRFILVLFLVHVMGAEVMLAALGCVCSEDDDPLMDSILDYTCDSL